MLALAAAIRTSAVSSRTFHGDRTGTIDGALASGSRSSTNDGFPASSPAVRGR
jgi:hypothetical protein